MPYADQAEKPLSIPAYSDAACPDVTVPTAPELVGRLCVAASLPDYKAAIGPRREFDPANPIVRGALLRLGISDTPKDCDDVPPDPGPDPIPSPDKEFATYYLLIQAYGGACEVRRAFYYGVLGVLVTVEVFIPGSGNNYLVYTHFPDSDPQRGDSAAALFNGGIGPVASQAAASLSAVRGAILSAITPDITIDGLMANYSSLVLVDKDFQASPPPTFKPITASDVIGLEYHEPQFGYPAYYGAISFRPVAHEVLPVALWTGGYL